MNRVHFILADGVYPYVTGGMEIFNYYLIKYLSANFNISYSSYNKLDIQKTQYHKCLKIRPVKFIYPLQVFFYLLFHRNIKTVVVSYSAASWIVWYLYYMILKLLHQDYIVIIHYGKEPPAKHRCIFTKFFKSSKKVISVSSEIKKNYDTLFNINSMVIFPIIPFEYSSSTKIELRNKYNIPLEKNVICMIGSIKQMKNPDTLLKCLLNFTEAELNEFNLHIVYAGDGAMRFILEQYVSDNHLDKMVTFLGVIPKEEVKEIYKLSDIYLIASDFEGTSVSLLEAMFNKMPIITSRSPGIVDTIREGEECLMFTTKDSSDLKKCIITLLSNKSLANTIAVQANNHFKKDYSFDKVLATYISLLS